MRDKCNKITAIIILMIIFGISAFYLPQMLTPTKQCFVDLRSGASIGTVMSTFVSDYKRALTSSRGWIDTYGLIQKCLGKHEIKNFAIISDEQGNLYNKFNGEQSKEEINKIYEDIERIYNTTVENDGAFLYVQMPFKWLSNDDRLNQYKNCYGNYNSDILGLLIEENMLPYMDLRDEKDEWEFYKSDHHWTLNSAFEATDMIVDELNALYDVDLNENDYYTNINNYSEILYENSFLGSAGIHVGEYYSGLDDFNILVPEFDTELEFEHYIDGKLSVSAEGDFWEALIDEDILEDSQYYNKYNAFTYTGYYETLILNKMSNNNRKLLLITNSYGRPMVLYLSLMFEETRYLDPQDGRYNDNYLEYIEEYRPDVVIVMYNDRINTIE